MNPHVAEARETRKNGHAAPPAVDLRAAPWLILLGGFAYAFVRYIVFGGVDAAQIPLFVTNKALAVGSVVYLLMAGLETVRRRAALSRRWGRWALHAAALHAVMSLSLLTAPYYPRLFTGDQLSWSGEISLLAAVLTLYCFYTLGKGSKEAHRPRAAVACVLACLHVGFYGFTGWFDVASWHGGMPPISLIGFAAASSALVAYAISLRGRDSVGQRKRHDRVARRRA